MKKYNSSYNFPLISKEHLRLPFLVTTVGKENQCRIYRRHGIEDHQFLFTIGGEGEVIIDEKKYFLEPGTLLYHTPHCIHDYKPTKAPWSVYWITFIQSFTLFSEKSGIYQLGDINKCTNLIEEILKINQDVLYSEQASITLYKLILEINHQLENSSYVKFSHRLQTAMNYINKHYCQDIELSDLSKLCGLSDEYFCRLFKKTYGVTAFSYIHTLKIQEAKKRLLLYDTQNLSQLSNELGYHSVNYFVTDFKNSTGMTPTEFRKYHFGIQN